MPKELYVPRRFSDGNLDKVEKANAIVVEYAAKGFSLTLRQLYYQFVARGFIHNNIREYHNLASVVNDARLAGMLDWMAIEDRTRGVEKPNTWDSPASIVEACAAQFAFDRWEDRPRRVEVWIEKDALSGVVEPVCTRWQLPMLACRGYVSQSEQWRAGKRFLGNGRQGQRTVVLYLGDHDPSGIDMTRDHRDRLDMFAPDCVEVRRIALNMPQVEEQNPPPNPAKLTDSRAKEYIKNYGDDSWELDALSPEYIDALIEAEVSSLVDQEAYEAAAEREGEAQGRLRDAATRLRDGDED